MTCLSAWPVCPHDLFVRMTCLSAWPVGPHALSVRMTCLSAWPVCPNALSVRMICLSAWPVYPHNMSVRITCLSAWPVCPHDLSVCMTLSVRMTCLSAWSVCPHNMSASVSITYFPSGRYIYNFVSLLRGKFFVLVFPPSSFELVGIFSYCCVHVDLSSSTIFWRSSNRLWNAHSKSDLQTTLQPPHPPVRKNLKRNNIYWKIVNI